MDDQLQEWTQSRRDLIDLIDDLSGRLRRGVTTTEATTMLETALAEIEQMGPGELGR